MKCLLMFIVGLFGVQALLGQLGAEQNMVASVGFGCCGLAVAAWIMSLELEENSIAAGLRAGVVHVCMAKMPEGRMEPAKCRNMRRAAQSVLAISLIALGGAYVIPAYPLYAALIAAIALLVLLRPHVSEDVRIIATIVLALAAMTVVVGGLMLLVHYGLSWPWHLA